MVFIIRKVDKKTYQVRNKFSGIVKAVRPSHSAAQAVANELNRRQASEGAAYVRASDAGEGKYA